jgi:hypothetical protein
MTQTTSAHGEECHGAAQTGFAHIQSAKIMVCDAPALAIRADSLAERLRKITGLGAGTLTPGAVSLNTLAGLFAEHSLTWRPGQVPGHRFAEPRSILTLRI